MADSEGLLKIFPPGVGEGVGGLNVGRAAAEDEGDDDEGPPGGRRLKQKDVPNSGGAAEPVTLPDLASEITQNRAAIDAARKRREEAVAREQAGLEQRATKLAPAITQVEQAIQAPAPPPPVPLQLAPPPSRQLTDFLAPVQGESPQNTIAKVIEGIGLLATGFTGLRRGDSKAALASLSGALKGWHEGDKERADRAFADWEAQSDKLIKEHASRHKRWQEILEDKRLTMEQAMKFLELEGLRDGYDRAAGTFAKQSIEESMKFMQEDQRQLLTLQDHRERLIQQREEKERHREFLKELHDQKVAEAKERDDALIKQYTDNPQTLKVLGQAWFLKGELPRGIGVGRAGAIVKGLVMKGAMEWAQENGIDPMSSPVVQAEMKATSGALARLRTTNAIQMAAIQRLDGHLDALLKLSDMVPRSEMPAVNGAILRGEKDYKGSPEAAAYVFQSFEVGMEMARVVVGSAQGDQATRDEARKQVAAELAKGQVKAVVGQLRQNAHRNLETNKASERALQEIIDTVGGRTKGGGIPAAHPAGAAPTGATAQKPDFIWDAAAGKLVKP